MIQSIAHQFTVGGPFMWVLLGVLAVSTAVIVERAIYFYHINKADVPALLQGILSRLGNGDGAGAAGAVPDTPIPLYTLVRTALERYAGGATIEQVRDGVEQRAVKELPKIGRRLNYLSLFANVATLLGLLGTIAGLQVSFSSLASVDAAQKASMLASGIAQAMNTTAFGLIVAVCCMVMYTVLTNKKQQLATDIDDVLLRIINAMKEHRS